VLLGLAACGPAITPAPTGYQGTALSGPAPAFALVDQAGDEVTLDNLRGRVVVLAFLDSRCLDVCPRTAADLRQVYHALGEQAARTAFVGVNINAQAATRDDVRAATEAWGLTEIESWRFLTGTAAELATVWADYHIGVVPAAGGAGPLEHTAGVYLIDPAGEWRWFVSTADDGSSAFPEFTPTAELLLAHVEGLLPPG
jgi:cytochrome oxidase Cu insertion factor (SCO1/SenC/PrrC family)